jgi:serine protease Do
MFPIQVDPEWYHRYWYSDPLRRTQRPLRDYLFRAAVRLTKAVRTSLSTSALRPQGAAQPQKVGHDVRRLIVLAFALASVLWPGAPALARSMEVGDAAAVRRAAPAVVNILTWKMPASDQPGGSPRRVKSYGSGFVIDAAGVLVTNKHVIDGAIEIRAMFSDGSVAPARLLAASPLIDLALLKVDVGHPLASLAWGDSDSLQVGDPVFTVGNQLGLGTAVSAGIVSALNRNLQDSPFDNYIQTDAGINHGDSGGPLIDRDGKVVGVDTALYNPDQNGGFIGIGFAIPASTAAFVAKRLLDRHHPELGWLGFDLQDLTGDLAEALGAPQPTGAVISAVDPSGPAGQAQLRPGDVLEQINGENQSDARAFMRAIAMAPIGQPVQLTVWREGKEQSLAPTVSTWPEVVSTSGIMTGKAAAEMIAPEQVPGVQLAPITDADRELYGLGPKLLGVLVAHVESDCEARDLGIQPGDVIIAVQGMPVAMPDDVQIAIRQANEQGRSHLAVLIQSKTGAKWVSISIGGVRS